MNHQEELVVFGESSIKSLSLEQLMEDQSVAVAFSTFIEDDGGNNYLPHLIFWREMRKFSSLSNDDKRKRAVGLVTSHIENKVLFDLVPSDVVHNQYKLQTEPIRILEEVDKRVTEVLKESVRRFVTSGSLPKKKTTTYNSVPPPSSSSPPLPVGGKLSKDEAKRNQHSKPLPPPPPGERKKPSKPSECPSSPPGPAPSSPPPKKVKSPRSPTGSKRPSSPIDVASLDESKIKKLKLKDVMKEPTLLQLFENFLTEELAVENLLFYHECQAYRSVKGGDEDRIAKSDEIKEAFFSPSSSHALFITAAEKNSMEELKGTPRMFEQIEGRVMMELGDLFRRFVNSGKLSKALLGDRQSHSPPSTSSSPACSPPSSPLSSSANSSSSSGRKKKKSRVASSSDAEPSKITQQPPVAAPSSPPPRSKSPPHDGPSSPRKDNKDMFGKKKEKSATSTLSLSQGKKSAFPPPAKLTGENSGAVLKKLKLKDVFGDEYLQHVFERYVDAEMAIELIHFWKETRVYRGLNSLEARIEKRDDIWTLFFFDKSPHRMHLTGAEREELEGKKKGGEAPGDLFLNVESRVWMELSDVLRKFIASGKLATTIEADRQAWETPASPTGTFGKRSRKEKERATIKGLGDRSTKKEKKEEADKDRKKAEEEKDKKKYAHLDPSDLTKNKNPNKLSLLDPATQEIITKAGIPGNTAEQDPRLWAVLTNSLRFLKLDNGLKYSKKITPSEGVGLEESNNLLAGPVPSKLKLNDQIGEGAFGQVFKCRCPPLGKGYFALKKMVNDTEKHTRMNLREIQVLKENPHPNIVKFHAAYIFKNEYWAVCELLEGGTLEEGHSEFLEGHIAYAAKHILSALSFLHKKKIAHRDLKSANIMLDVEGHIKLIDFGLSVSLQNGPQVGMCGSPYWLSPEMIRMDPHSFPTDIWSFAISLLEMINGVPPNRDNPLKLLYDVGSMTDDMEPVLQLDNPAKWSDELKDFLRSCLMPDPTKRATADELLKHKLISKSCTKEKMGAVLSQIFIKHSLNDIGLGI